MSRPTEYENLIRTRALEAVQPTPGAVAGFLKNAESFLALSTSLLAGTPLATEPMQVFTNAYEGYHQLVQAVSNSMKYAPRRQAARWRSSASAPT